MIRVSLKSCLILLITLVAGNSSLKAQEIINLDSLGVIEYSLLTLPPIDVLYENAKTSPSYQFADVNEKIERSLLRKEAKAWLGFFSVRASWQYGKFGNDVTYSDVATPIIYTYNTASQVSYSVGAAVSIPLNDLFDLRGRYKRQKLNVRGAELQKEKEFELIKKEIVQLYAIVNAELNVLKRRAESVVLATEQYKIIERHFTNGTATSEELAVQKENQSMAIQRFEDTKLELNKSLLVLEIISNTTIIRR
ncbi:TolC family protein [Bacteroides sp. OttesenSCG-928-D19]|nr:TolC family protein [Bacteroides sp. OttesenSCG-928-D19]